MFVKIHHPIEVTGLGRVAVGQIIALAGREVLPLIRSGNASHYAELDDYDASDEAFERRKQRARELGQNPDWDKRPPYAGMRFVASMNGQPVEASDEDFGQKLTEAVQRRLASRLLHGHSTAASSSDDETFGEKLKQAVKRKLAK